MSLSDPFAGLQPWLRPYAVYASMWFQYVTGGELKDGLVGPYVEGGIAPVITSTYRSVEKQQELYDDRANNPYPVNRPGDSAHQYGLAFDSSVPNEWWPTWTAIRRAVGFRVPDNDRVHGEYPNWRSIVPSAS